MGLMTFTALSLSFAAAAAWTSIVAPLPPVTHYVDLASGSEAADGLTPGTAWQYIPGDPRSTHTSGYWTVAGRHCRVLGSYEGAAVQIINAGGTAENPCYLTGADFGGPMATWHGGDPVTVRAPTSQADAGGHPNWNNGVLKIAEWIGTVNEDQLYDDGGVLVPSRFPKALNRYLADDIEASTAMYYDGIDGVSINTTGHFSSAPVAAAATVGCKVFFWVTGNEFASGTVSAVSGSLITLTDRTPGTAYASTRVFIEESVLTIEEGARAKIAPGKALVWPQQGQVRRAVPRAEGYRRINPHAASSHLHIRGFRFTGFAWVPGEFATYTYAIETTNSGANRPDNVRVAHNLFTDNFGKPCNLIAGTNHRIVENIVQNGYKAGGFTHSCERNILRNLGDTGIRTGGDNDQVYRYNILYNVGGVHSNGISIYESGTGHLIEYNAVILTDRSVTHQGGPLADSGRIFRYNILRHRLTSVATELQRMGFRQNGASGIDGVIYEGNMMTGVNNGLGIYMSSASQVIINNVTSGILYQTTTPDTRAGWTQTGNVLVPNDYLYGDEHTMTDSHVIAHYPAGSGLTTPDGKSFIEIDLRYLDAALSA